MINASYKLLKHVIYIFTFDIIYEHRFLKYYDSWETNLNYATRVSGYIWEA
jgi:hypothetical protein